MTIYLIALLMGIVAGLRTMSAPAAVSWAAYLGVIDLSGTWFAFLGFAYTPWILSVLAIAELVVDQLPSTPSRKVPVQFGARILSGALCGAAIGAAHGALPGGLVLGTVGAVLGTLAGAATRARLAAAFGNDRPAALIEDVIAIGGAVLIMASARMIALRFQSASLITTNPCLVAGAYSLSGTCASAVVSHRISSM